MKKLIFGLTVCFTLLGTVSYASFPVENSKSATIVEESSSQKEITSTEHINTADFNKNIDELAKVKATKGDDKKLIAIILGLVSVLLLPFAFHNWYLKKNKKALWQTLMVFPGFILLGLPALASWIWQIVDLIKILINGAE